MIFYVVAVRKYLKDNEDVFKKGRGESPRPTNELSKKYQTEVTANDISEWLDESTENEAHSLFMTRDNIVSSVIRRRERPFYELVYFRLSR